MPGDLAGYIFTKPEGLVKYESMLVIETPPSMNARQPSQSQVLSKQYGSSMNPTILPKVMSK